MVRAARRVVRVTRRTASQYLGVGHSRARGASGHLHARLTKGEYWKRQYIPLLASYYRSGYSITLSPSLEFLDGPQGEEFALLRSPWLRLRRNAPKGSLILTDDKSAAERLHNSGERVGLVAVEDYTSDWGASSLALPYMMHPSLYSPEKIALSDSQAGSPERDIKVFFAGNFKPGDYDEARLVDKFSVETRIALKSRIESSFHAVTMWIKTWEEKEKLRNIDKPILIVDSNKAGLKYDEYFDLLGRSAFFLAMPGIASPNCHNLPEAMSRGCIPIIENAKWFDPLPFVSGVNCIEFRTADGFVPAVREALEMDEEATALLRAGVNEIWERFFQSSAIVRRVNEVIDSARDSLPVILIKPES
ncbi:MAG: hypothetical protein ABI556_05735 [Gemmatimonadales bacterium]